MDEFLADYYNTLGYGEGMEKDASEVSPWGYYWEDLEEAAVEKLAARYQPDAAARAKRDEFLRRREAGSQPTKTKGPVGKTQYDAPIGPTKGKGPKAGGKFQPSDEMRARMEEGKRRRASSKTPKMTGQQYDKPIGGTQYDKPIGPSRPPASSKHPRTTSNAYMSPIGPEKPKSVGLMQRAKARWGKMGRAGKAGVIAGSLGAAGLAGYGGYRAATREKKSSDSAFDQLIEERAFGILAENGLADEYGNVVPPDTFEKTAEYDDFEDVVDDAALELLEQYGYPVERY